MPAGTAPTGAFHAASTQLKGAATATGASGCAALGAGELSVKLQQGGDGGRRAGRGRPRRRRRYRRDVGVAGSRGLCDLSRE